MKMKPRQKYVPLDNRVPPEQKEYARQYAKAHHISANQFVRDAIQHAIECPFFNGRSSTSDSIPPTEGSSE